MLEIIFKEREKKSDVFIMRDPSYPSQGRFNRLPSAERYSYKKEKKQDLQQLHSSVIPVYEFLAIWDLPNFLWMIVFSRKREGLNMSQTLRPPHNLVMFYISGQWVVIIMQDLEHMNSLQEVTLSLSNLQGKLERNWVILGAISLRQREVDSEKIGFKTEGLADPGPSVIKLISTAARFTSCSSVS